MAKYRLLNQEELDSMKDDFVKYLILNGITGDDWKRMQETNPAEAQKITDLFSDVVFEKIMRGIKFIDHIEAQKIYTFQCLREKIVLVGVVSENAEMDFTNSLPSKVALSKMKIFTQSKGYNKERELELFDMIQAGAQISNGELFKSLSLLL